MHRMILAAALLALPWTLSAEVVSASPNGFQLRHTLSVPVGPEAALASFGDVGAWWNPAHSYSGDAGNMSLELKPGGCFCESLPAGGGVEHMRVAYIEPGKRLVLTGSLGPLLYEATTAVMDVRVKATTGGSELVLDYRAAGFSNGGANKLAPLVDQVLAEQMERYRASTEQR